MNNSSLYNEPLGRVYSREEALKRSNFYVSSFKQLNSMQSKQVGLVMGACVADSALRALEGLDAKAVQSLIDKNDAYETSLLREAMKERSKAASETSAAQAASPIDASSPLLPTYTSYDPIKRPNGFSLLDPCIFSSGGVSPKNKKKSKQFSADDSLYGGVGLSSSQATASSWIDPTFKEELMATRESHSYSYLFFKEYLRAVTHHRHAVELAKVKSQWAAIEHAFPMDHSAWHGSCPHAVAAMACSPANYPWAADDSLRSYAEPFVSFLTTAGVASTTQNAAGVEAAKEGTNEELIFDPNVVPQALSALSLPLRCLAHNPDPVRYNALQAMPFSEDIFPLSHRSLVPGAAQIEGGGGDKEGMNGFTDAFDNAESQPETSSAPLPSSTATSVASSSAVVLSPAILQHRQTMRTAMHIIDKARTFTEGVLMCSRAATCGYPNAAGLSTAHGLPSTIVKPLPTIALGPLAIIVGAALGAKFAVKSIPVEWLAATADHEVVGTHAIQLAEWSWNTPSRLKK